MQREQVSQTLAQWQSGEMDELAVWQWASEAVEARQESGPESDELVRDIVDLLAALPYEMVIAEDITVFQDALDNPPDETDLSINLLWNHMDAVDVDSRRMALAGHPFYGEFANAD